jgi:CRISPR/Cas system-associated exonuclease Cas4 (RecB family)
MICDERAYLKRRAFQELAMTLAADGEEAEDVHNELTGRYLRACVGCRRDRTDECAGCALALLCSVDLRSSHPLRVA